MKYLFVLLLLAANTAMANCNLSIEANDAMQFNSKEMTAAASCKTVTLTLKHVGKLPANVMGHNWVLAKTADVPALANAGMGAGLANNYLPEKDDRILASSKIIGGGEQLELTIDMTKLSVGGDYSFFCSFPGHWALMRGVFKVI